MKADDFAWILEAIRDHQNTAPDEEVCGFVCANRTGGLSILTARNRAPDRRVFAIPDLETARVAQQRKIVYAYHTHPDGNLASDVDDQAATAYGHPYLVVTFAGPKPRWRIVYPYAEVTEFVGRPFDWNTANCAHLVADYWLRKFGVSCRVPPTVESDWKEHGASVIDTVAAHWPVEEVGTLEPGDAVAFDLATGPHLAIYLGDGLLLEQPANRPSRTSELAPPLARRIAHRYRVRR